MVQHLAWMLPNHNWLRWQVHVCRKMEDNHGAPLGVRYSRSEALCLAHLQQQVMVPQLVPQGHVHQAMISLPFAQVSMLVVGNTLCHSLPLTALWLCCCAELKARSQRHARPCLKLSTLCAGVSFSPHAFALLAL